MSEKKSKQTTKKPVELAKPVVKKDGDVQIHFGNAELIKIRLLEAIAKNTAQIARLMGEVKEEK